jgi:hypothetical protein
MSLDKEGVIVGAIALGAMALLRPNRAGADKLLREKWFTIGQGTRLKAKTHLEDHLMSLEDKF